MNRVNADEIELTNDYVYLWDGRPFTGIAFELDDHENIVSEIEFRNGLQMGTTRAYYPKGRLKREAQYENATLHGFARDWNEEGLVTSEEEYERGICIRRKTRDSTGNLSISYELKETDPQFEILRLLRMAKFAPPPRE
jgi:antitoxin component YwqK of YwqJK toxin-antitoxin module